VTPTTHRFARARAGTTLAVPDAGERNPEKDPEDWTTGDEPMTGPQASYLSTLCQEAGEPFDEGLTKAQASRRIEELQQRTGRGGAGAGASDSGTP
jgi:Protein of unknown function (DUF3072)